MWRSVTVRSAFSKRLLHTSGSPKVLRFNRTLIPHSSTCLIPKTSHYHQIPSFFLFFLSHYSTTPTPSTNEPIDDDRAFTTDNYSNVEFDQELNLVSSESISFSSEDFDGDSGSLLEEPDSFTESGDSQSDLNNISLESGDGSEQVYEIDTDKLESVLSLLQSSVDGSLESSLDGLDLDLHQEFVVRVIETPLITGENLIGFFKWALNKPGFSATTRVVEALVRAIGGGLRKKEAYAVWDLVKELAEKENGVVNVEILNELIALFSRLGKGKAGLEVFNKFGDFGCVPNEDTYYFTIGALCRRKLFDWAGSASERMLSAGCLPESEKIGKIISWFCSGRRGRDAHSVYLLAKEKNKYPPRSSINYLISTLCREDETVQLALEMLGDYSGETRKHAIKPFSAVISGLCRIKDVEGAKELLFKMTDGGPPPGNAVFNSVINAFAKAGDMEDAKKMMSLMKTRGLKPDVFTYTVIMSGYAKGGQMDDACKVLSEAKKKHTKLSPVTYHTLIRGYCKLEEFDKALNLLAEMKDYGVRANTDEYSKLIQSLCLKALDWKTAEKLLEEMKEKGLHLSGITQGLIRAVKELEEEVVVHEGGEVAEA